MKTAMSALQQIQLQGGIVDMAKITSIATDASAQASNAGYSLVFSLILICWLYSIVDAYLAGTKANRRLK